jgi:hypothetical protein
MRRRWSLGILALVGGFGIAAMCGQPVVAARSTPTTDVVHLSPVDAQGALAPGFTIRHRFGDANCSSGSPTVGKAYECFTPQSGQGVFDSCWVQADHHFVLCLVEPWQHKVARLHVTRGYGKGPGFHQVHLPWGVRIGNRIHCGVILAPTDTTRGHYVDYSCNHKEVLAGPINRHGATWRAHAYRKVHHGGHRLAYKSLGVRPIATAWFGKASQKA